MRHPISDLNMDLQRLGARYVCSLTDPTTREVVARGTGRTKDAAMRAALADAQGYWKP